MKYSSSKNTCRSDWRPRLINPTDNYEDNDDKYLPSSFKTSFSSSSFDLRLRPPREIASRATCFLFGPNKRDGFLSNGCTGITPVQLTWMFSKPSTVRILKIVLHSTQEYVPFQVVFFPNQFHFVFKKQLKPTNTVYDAINVCISIISEPFSIETNDRDDLKVDLCWRRDFSCTTPTERSISDFSIEGVTCSYTGIHKIRLQSFLTARSNTAF